MFKKVLIEVGVTLTLIVLASLQIDRIERWGR